MHLIVICTEPNHNRAFLALYTVTVQHSSRVCTHTVAVSVPAALQEAGPLPGWDEVALDHVPGTLWGGEGGPHGRKGGGQLQQEGAEWVKDFLCRKDVWANPTS